MFLIGQSELGIIPKSFVLEEDGTEIDDDAILQEMMNKTIIALAGEEEWCLPDQIIIQEIPCSSQPECNAEPAKGIKLFVYL